MNKHTDTSDIAPTANAEHTDNTTSRASDTPIHDLHQSHGGYKVSRFNAVRHGVLSQHTVLWWEDNAEYEALLAALVEEHAPQGPTESHLVEEIAGTMWRKRRLRLAEAASYQQGLKDTADPRTGTLDRALVQVDRLSHVPIIDAVSMTPLETAEELAELKLSEASAHRALRILTGGKADSYEEAMAELDEGTRARWEEQIAPEPEYTDENDDDMESYTADAPGLAQYLEQSVLPFCARKLKYAENRSVIRTQALGEALNLEKIEQLSRYEVHLDRKLERMLAMLLRYQNEGRLRRIGYKNSSSPGVRPLLD